MIKQIIYLINDGNDYYSHKQIDEINKLFERYDIKVISNIKINNEDDIRNILTSNTIPETIILAALHIKNTIKFTDVKKEDKITIDKGTNDLLLAQEACRLYAYTLHNNNLICKQFSCTTDGYLEFIFDTNLTDEELQQKFILKNTLLTYADLEKINMKNTSQGIAVSKFICDEIYYAPPINLNFNPQKQNSTIDFRNDPANFLKDNIHLNNPLAVQYGLTGLFRTVLNRGVFFRAPKNRREKNYWCPALNAGLPLTPKRDVIHEITYMAHDFGHFLIPDLLFTGVHNALNQQLYIIYRMMSEAFTLVLADMLFVDSLKRSGFEYDYTKRKIYPLFEECELDLSQQDLFFDHIKKLLQASVNYCLKGNDENFYMLSKKHRLHSPALDNFKEKYMKFFCEDFKWTRNNYNYFRNNADESARWWDLVNPLRRIAQLDTESIEEFAGKIDVSNECLIDTIFNELYQRVSTILSSKFVKIDSFEVRQRKAFFRYMMGQLSILVRYEHVVKEAKVFQKMICDYLTEITHSISMDDIDFCRSLLSDFVDILLQKNLINYDDAETFKDVFPVFEPSFAFYDEKIDFYRDLSSVAYESIYHN